jgi:hypothetical protein
MSKHFWMANTKKKIQINVIVSRLVPVTAKCCNCYIIFIIDISQFLRVICTLLICGHYLLIALS